MTYLKKFGSRIQTQLNGIKRPINIAAKELNIDENKLQNCIKGILEESETLEIVNKIITRYPIKMADIFVEKNIAKNGVIYCNREMLEASSRIISRPNKDNKLTEFYKYYDCAIDKNIPFKPELIEILREVDNNNPEDKDVAYNRGHLETQMTFYVGPVNFYYKIQNEKICTETVTGYSSIKNPYVPHTFTTRNCKEPSKIIAVTFSNNFALNLSNLSYVQESFLDKISGNLRHPEKVLKIRLERYLELNCLTLEELRKILNKSFSENEVSDFVDHGIYNDSIAKSLENILNINSSDLKFNKLNKEDEVVVETNQTNELFIYNNLPHRKLACSKFIKNVSHYDVIINNDTSEIKSNYYQFIYNYGDNPFKFSWGESLENEIQVEKDENLIMYPNVNYKIEKGEKETNIYLAKIPGIINENILNEYSLFDNNNRYRALDNENSQWW